MPDPASQPVDLWALLDEAEETVERWPEWQQRYADADSGPVPDSCRDEHS